MVTETLVSENGVSASDQKIESITAETSQGRNDRNQALDALRGVAVLLVLSCHYGEYPYRFFLAVGWSGVDLFFVLSGFLISGLLFADYKKTGTINVKRFWIRRGFKIYPPFYALIATTALGCLLSNGTVPTRILSDVFFLQSYVPSFWSHGWSLAVEEHFYFLLPLLLLGLVRLDKSKPFRWLPIFSIALTVLCLYMRIVTSRHTMEWLRTLAPTHLRMDALFAGVTLGYFNHFDSVSFRACCKVPFLWLAGALLLLPSFAFPGTVFMDTVGLTFTFLGYALILMWAVNRPTSNGPLVRFLSAIGYYSYSIYLWHLAVATLVFDHLPQNALLFVGYFVMSITVGVGMSKLLEIPSLRIRDRYFPSVGNRAKAAA